MKNTWETNIRGPWPLRAYGTSTHRLTILCMGTRRRAPRVPITIYNIYIYYLVEMNITHTQALARVYLYGCINICVYVGIYIIVYRNRHKHSHIHIGPVIPAQGGNGRAAVCIAVSGGRLLATGGGAPERAVGPGHQHDCRPGSRTTSCHGTSNAHKNRK